MEDGKDEKEKPADPPGEGESLEDAARDSIEEMERSGTHHAGRGDGG